MSEKNTLETLEKVIRKRKGSDPKKSYVAKMMDRGTKKIAQKVVEEAGELAIAAVAEGRKEVVEESADLLFHMMVLLAKSDIAFSEVTETLASREGISGLVEKAKRKK